MFGNSLKSLKLLSLAVSLIIAVGSLAFAENTVKALGNESFGVAISGYDAVAYFTDSKAVKGDDKYSYTWNEAVWHFSSTEHREMFAANPKKYVPHRGGW